MGYEESQRTVGVRIAKITSYIVKGGDIVVIWKTIKTIYHERRRVRHEKRYKYHMKKAAYHKVKEKTYRNIIDGVN